MLFPCQQSNTAQRPAGRLFKIQAPTYQQQATAAHDRLYPDKIAQRSEAKNSNRHHPLRNKLQQCKNTPHIPLFRISLDQNRLRRYQYRYKHPADTIKDQIHPKDPRQSHQRKGAAKHCRPKERPATTAFHWPSVSKLHCRSSLLPSAVTKTPPE